MKKRKDDLLLQNLKLADKKDIVGQYKKAGEEFDKMSGDLQAKIKGISSVLDGVLANVDAKKAALV